MIPEITIKISFTPTSNGGRVEPTVTTLDIAPPELPAEAAALVPPPPAADEGPGDSFASDIPPPPSATMTEEQVPPLPEDYEGSPGDTEEPPPPPRGRGRGRSEG